MTESMPIARARLKLPGDFLSEQSSLILFAECGEKIVEVERRPGVSVPRQKCVPQPAPQISADPARAGDRLPGLTSQRSGNQPPVTPVQRGILQSKCIARVAGQGFVAALAS